MYVGCLKEVINENKIITNIRKVVGKADDIANDVGGKIGGTIGRVGGGVVSGIVNAVPMNHIPVWRGFNQGLTKGFHKGIVKGANDVDGIVSAGKRKLGKALGAYDDEKSEKKKD